MLEKMKSNIMQITSWIDIYLLQKSLKTCRQFTVKFSAYGGLYPTEPQ